MAEDSDRLSAIVFLIDRIDASLTGIDLATFAANPLRVDATAHRLMHVGENTLHLSARVKARHPDQPWPLMAAFRNLTAHDYFGTAEPILWKTARDHLAPLRRLCVAELAAADNTQGE